MTSNEWIQFFGRYIYISFTNYEWFIYKNCSQVYISNVEILIKTSATVSRKPSITKCRVKLHEAFHCKNTTETTAESFRINREMVTVKHFNKSRAASSRNLLSYRISFQRYICQQKKIHFLFSFIFTLSFAEVVIKITFQIIFWFKQMSSTIQQQSCPEKSFDNPDYVSFVSNLLLNRVPRVNIAYWYEQYSFSHHIFNLLRFLMCMPT